MNFTQVLTITFAIFGGLTATLFTYMLLNELIEIARDIKAYLKRRPL